MHNPLNPRTGYPRRWGRWPRWGFGILGLGCAVLVIFLGLAPLQAQTVETVEQQEDAAIQQYSPPPSLPPAPVARPTARPPASPPRSDPAPADRPATDNIAAPSVSPDENPPATDSDTPANDLRQYVIQFDRSPVVGNALQMQGVLSQSRLGFTKPRHWQVASAKLILRFRHSPALYANRSNLTVRLNNRHLGSVPLNREDGAVSNIAFDITPIMLEDFNTVIMEVQQHTSDTCTDPKDPTLWTEILPDSQVVLNYRTEAIPLDFVNYPYPFVDSLGLDSDRLTYLQPTALDPPWLTAIGRYQTAASRSSSGRPMQTRLVQQLDQVEEGDRLVILGTPTQQPKLAELSLPFVIDNNQVLDGDGTPLPGDVGVLILTTTPDGATPVLIATGNDDAAVLKAVQALVQPADQQLLTGQAALVKEVADVETPAPMDWPGYLPEGVRQLTLNDLEIAPDQRFQDVTVSGTPLPPPVELPLRILPNEQVMRGGRFTLRYSYGPGIDPRRSSVSVMLNGRGIGGERLRSQDGGTDSVTVTVPPELATPTSRLAIQFFTFPDTPINCGVLPDQPTWGTVHGTSTVNFQRSNSINLTDLGNLKTGFPLTAPQDLSDLTLVLPNQPSESEVATLLAVSDRLGRLSRGQSVKLEVHTPDSLGTEARQRNLVAIGLRDNFPIPEMVQPENPRFRLGEQFGRQRRGSQIQTLPDQAGVIQAQVSPWNPERLILGLLAQTPMGLTEVQQMFQRDALFARLSGDTVIVQRTTANPSAYNRADYRVISLNQRDPKILDRRSIWGRTVAFFQRHWFLLPIGLLALALLLYSLSQAFLNRFSRPEGSQ
ncbi:MAG: cellulose biosynthesis cyclic di-GMP-binding regulatory protein BcsB [Leptolyngbya sp.]|nr:cellulose biosynthesis cyclic di-GMP-binding regulatory protein BcsB [Leptolyngbya sp.]